LDSLHGRRSVLICPRCNMRVLISPDNEIVEHECNSGNEVLDQEDVHVVGDWEDYSGSGKAPLPNYQGIENRLQMSRGGVEGEDVNSVTVRGNTSSTCRQRPHIKLITR